MDLETATSDEIIDELLKRCDVALVGLLRKEDETSCITAIRGIGPLLGQLGLAAFMKARLEAKLNDEVRDVPRI